MSLTSSLRLYADSLAPSQAVLDRAGELIKEIQDVMHRHLGSRFSIDRIRPLGSLTKKTSLWFKMDVDIVVYLNDEMPPYKRFKDELCDVITKHIDEDCESHPKALKLKFKELEVDLLPARNFLYSKGPTDDANEQIKNTLLHMRDNFNPAGRDKLAFSSCLSEGAIAFERGHSAFSHSLSRLAKVWSLTIGIPDFTFGRSTIMEYLGASAAEEEERCGRQDLLRGFRIFLEMIVRSGDLYIYWTRFYPKNDIPQYIQKQRPLLLDPTNPYNNLLQESLGDYVKKMGPYARETLNRLEEAEKSEILRLEKIFEPQPTWPIFFRMPKGKTPRNFLVGHERNALSLPKIETRSGAKGVDSGIAKSYLFAFSDAATTAAKINQARGLGQGGDITEIVLSDIKKFISPGSQWPSCSERHESRHMTFTIPVGKDANEVIKISCDWA